MASRIASFAAPASIVTKSAFKRARLHRIEYFYELQPRFRSWAQSLQPTSLLIPHMVQVALVLPARCQSWLCILQWLSQLLSLLQYKWHETTPAAIRNRADATVALPSLGLHSSNIDSPPSLGLHLPNIKLPPGTNSRPLTCCRDWTHAL